MNLPDKRGVRASWLFASIVLSAASSIGAAAEPSRLSPDVVSARQSLAKRGVNVQIFNYGQVGDGTGDDALDPDPSDGKVVKTCGKRKKCQVRVSAQVTGSVCEVVVSSLVVIAQDKTHAIEWHLRKLNVPYKNHFRFALTDPVVLDPTTDVSGFGPPTRVNEKLVTVALTTTTQVGATYIVNIDELDEKGNIKQSCLKSDPIIVNQSD